MSGDFLEGIKLFYRYKKGDQAAWEEIYVRYSKPLLKFVCRIIRDLTAAENIVHETFLELDEYNPERIGNPQLFTFLCEKAKWKARKWVKSPWGRPLSKIDEFIPIKKESEPGRKIEKQDEEIKQKAAVQQCLNVLSYQRKTILVLKVIKELTFERIAEIVKMSISSVSDNYYNAMEKFLYCLKEKGVAL